MRKTRGDSVRAIMALSATLLIGAGLGRCSASGARASARPASEAAAAEPTTDVVPPAAISANLAPRPAARASEEAPVPGSEACQSAAREDEQRVREFQTKQLFDLLDNAVARAEMLLQSQGTEAIANLNYEYLRGWSDTVQRLAPDLADELAARVEEQLCDPKTSSAKKMTLARIGLGFSEVMTARGVDCVAASREEDVVLWATLDAWRNSGLEKSETLARLEAEATDPRTQRRFLPDEGRGEQADLAAE